MTELLTDIAKTIKKDGGVPGEARFYNQSAALVQGECLVFIGEAPGPTEVMRGRPFVGDAGKVLDGLCQEAGITAAYITNICKHFPGRDKDGKIKAPTVEESARWQPYLAEELAILQPKTVILLGVAACKWAFPGVWKLGSIVGTKVHINGIDYIAAWHPASFLYNQGKASNTKKMNQERRIFKDAITSEGISYPFHLVSPNRRSGRIYLDIETEGSTDIQTALIHEWAYTSDESEEATLCFDRSVLPPRPDSVVFHNAMFDYPILCRQDPAWYGVTDIHDSMVLAYTQGYEDLSLKGLSNQLFGVKVYDYSQRGECGAEIYNAQDVFLTRRLFTHLLPMSDGIAYDIDRRLIPLLTRASLEGGYFIDKKRLEAVIDQTEEEKANLEFMFQSRYNGINMGSSAQLLDVFPTKDTTADTLKKLGTMDAEIILRWRGLNTDLTRYLYPCRDLKRLTGKYRLTSGGDKYGGDDEGGTRTGRLSSYDRNLQNLDPILQACLHAPNKMELLALDYSQIELRVAAEISQDPFLLSVIREGRDIHAETQAFLAGYGINLSRGNIKPITFSILYLAGEGRVSQLVGNRDVAALIYSRLRELYAGFFAWAEHHWQEVQRTGLSISLDPYRHRRFIHTYNNKDAKKQAANHPVQSGAGYITKEAMAGIGHEPGVREFVNQVHDELHYFIQKGDKATQKYVYEAMMDIGNTRLPTIGVEVNVECSRYWQPKL